MGLHRGLGNRITMVPQEEFNMVIINICIKRLYHYCIFTKIIHVQPFRNVPNTMICFCLYLYQVPCITRWLSGCLSSDAVSRSRDNMKGCYPMIMMAILLYNDSGQMEKCYSLSLIHYCTEVWYLRAYWSVVTFTEGM